MADKAQFQEAVKRGSAFAWRGQWADAAREYRQALALSSDDASALNYLAMALFKSGQLEEALECYRRVWKTQPANLSALQKVAEVQDAMGDKDSAIASYRQISDQQMKRNSPDEALKALQKVVELRPTEAESWSALMSVAALAGNLGDMIPRSLTLARELFLKDRFQDAFRVAEQVQSIDPTNLAVPRLIAAFRKGLEYSYRTAAAGDDIHRGDMAQLIPPVEQLEQADYAAPDLPAPRTAPAAPAPRPQPVVPPAFVAPRPPEYSKPREPRTEGYARHPVPQPPAAVPGDEPPSVLPLDEISEALFPQLKLVREMALDAKFKEAFVVAERAQKEYPDNRAVAAMIAALRKGLEYVYARVATGREIVAEDIARLIPVVPEPPVPVALEPEAQPSEPEPQPEPETWGSMPGSTFPRSIEDLPSAVPSKVELAQLQPQAVEAAQGKPLPDGERALEAEATAPHESSREAEESAPPAPADGPIGAFAEIGEADAPGAAVPPVPVETEGDVPDAAESGVEEPAPEEAPVAPVEAPPGIARDEEPAAAGGEPPNAAEPSSPVPNPPAKPAKGLPWRQRLAEAWTQMSLKDEEEDEEDEEGDTEAETLAPAAPPSDLPTPVPSAPPKEAALTGQSLDGAVSSEAEVASLELEPAAARDTGIPSTGDLAGEQPALALDTEAGEDAAPESSSAPLVPTIPGFAAIEVMAGSIQPSPDSGSTRLLLQLAEDHLRLGRVPQAVAAYEELLSAFPDNLQGVLGLGRVRLALEQYDEAEATARRAVALSAPVPGDDEWPAGRLVLEIARERVARGDVVSAAAAFAWLRRATSSVALSPHLAELLATEPVELMGETIGNHLEEISQLSVGEAERIVPALWRAEKLLGERLLRSAADELYELLEEFPSFLPVQSLLGRVLLADGREDEAREKSRRLLELYEIRGTPDQGLEVLWWTVALGIAGEEDRATLVRLLRDGHRDRDADWIEKSRWGGNLRPARDARLTTVAVIGGHGEGVAPGSPIVGENGASRAAGYQPAGRNGSGREAHAEDPLAKEQLSSDNEGDAGGFDAAVPGLGDRPQGWEALLATAEDRYALGDLEGAAGLIRLALADCPEDATGSRAALTRMLKVVDRLDGEGNDVAESLRRLGLSEELAD